MGYDHRTEHPFYWPTVKVVHAPMTPAQAWALVQSGEIVPAQFKAILEAWNR